MYSKKLLSSIIRQNQMNTLYFKKKKKGNKIDQYLQMEQITKTYKS